MTDISVQRAADCWTVALDRPASANALSAAMVEALIETVAQAEAAGVAVLAFEGRGRNFSAGFDFSGFEAQSEGDLLQRFVRIELLLQAITCSPCLTVAFAHGRNFGAGVDLYAACRWRVAEESATFRMPGLAFGIVLGTRRFGAIVGRDNAREILEGLRTVTATEGRAMGFVRRIAAADAWPAVIEEAQATASGLPPESRVRLYRTLDGGGHDEDLAELVRSAAQPGLKQRMRDYLSAQERQRGRT
jgi:enoyl-CoA hydratase/carnithine racemase